MPSKRPRSVKSARVLMRHAQDRALQRYGVPLTKEVVEQIIYRIQNSLPGAEYVAKQSNTRSIWDVQVEGKWMRVVYDKARKMLVTVLPEAYREAS
jgi:hypothetical protein